VAEARSARETAKQETREALLRAAMDEFAEKGLDLPSLDAICARAGFTRGAFYVHFRDREELVAAVMERVLDAVLDAVIGAEGAAHDLATTVARYVAVGVVGIEDVGRGAGATGGGVLPAGVPFHQILAACQRDEPTRALMVGVLGRAAGRLAEAAEADQRAGRVRDDVPPGALAALLLLLALGVRAGADLRLPLDVAATRDAALGLLRPRQGSTSTPR
jgi:TetR/AcrR family transcriptional regulator, transcriptional repressor for nem operon